MPEIDYQKLDLVGIVRNHRDDMEFLENAILSHFENIKSSGRIKVAFKDIKGSSKFMKYMEEPGDSEDDTNIRATALILLMMDHFHKNFLPRKLEYCPTFGIPIVMESKFILGLETDPDPWTLEVSNDVAEKIIDVFFEDDPFDFVSDPIRSSIYRPS